MHDCKITELMISRLVDKLAVFVDGEFFLTELCEEFFFGDDAFGSITAAFSDGFIFNHLSDD